MTARRKKNSIFDKGTAHVTDRVNRKSLFDHIFPPGGKSRATIGSSSCVDVAAVAVVATTSTVERWNPFSASASGSASGRRKLVVAVILILSVSAAYVAGGTFRSVSSSPVKRTSSSSRHRRVVVSLSTTPVRLPHILPNLESLLTQEPKPPDAVYLTLPKYRYFDNATSQSGEKQIVFGSLDELPEFLRTLKSEHSLIILQPELDYGPITKAIYALEAEQSRGLKEPSIIVYLDDDVIYDPRLVERLSKYHLNVHPNSVVASSGAVLRSNFRQIKHTRPKLDKHPNLYFLVGFEANDPRSADRQNTRSVDIVQGFSGVCMSSNMLNITTALSLLHTEGLPPEVYKSDDFILSAMMEKENITRVLLPSNYVPDENSTALPSSAININGTIASMGRLSNGMHRHAIVAAHYLHSKLGIWSDKNFLDWSKLSSSEQKAINCEAAYEQACDNLDACFPSPEKCPAAKSVLERLS